MKDYVKPVIEEIELRPEERLAVCAYFRYPNNEVVSCWGYWVEGPTTYNG